VLISGLGAFSIGYVTGFTNISSSLLLFTIFISFEEDYWRSTFVLDSLEA
jgi:hypothetical protein